LNRSTGADELERVRQAQANVREARRLLRNPSAGTVEESMPHVQAAVHCLEELRHSLRSRAGRAASAELTAELTELRKEVSHASAQLERATALYRGWARLLYVAACGYTPNGQPAAPGPAPQLTVQG
jgi:hypothetical protein